MSKPPLLIPVENQVRELDAKVLLSCFAAERGYDAYVGWKGTIDNHINDFPSSVYFAKSLTERSVKIFKISRLLGHSIIAWDEEAIVHYPPEVYYTRRLSSEALGMAEHLLAWGQDNKTLFQGFPSFPDTPIEIVGNPRGDLLRPEFRPFFDRRVEEIKRQYGDFILFNTNFGTINGYYPQANVCYAEDNAPDGLALGRGAIGFTRDFAVRLFTYRTQVLEKFKQLVPDVARAFPDRTIVLRPHPAENRDFWREHLQEFDNVHVEAEGNVVPWLLASSVLVHNGCTTAVEGYILQRPVIAYVPLAGGEDFAVNPPNAVSDVAATVPEVIEKIGAVFDEAPITVNDPGRDDILGQFISSLDGDFAVSKIMDCVDAQGHNGGAPVLKRTVGSAFARGRRFVKKLKTTQNTGRYSVSFKQQKFPDVTVETLRDKIAHLSRLGGLRKRFEVENVLPDVFRVRST
ncbi:MAG: surface carbohydrate biosynthesis protein [Hyphomicrobiales bacterium]